MGDAALLIIAGAFAGGFVSGLTGFGTGLVTLPIWLHVVAPLLAAPLVVVCSLVAQLQTLPAIWHAVDLRRLAPFVAGCALGVPVGAWLLPHVSPATFRLGLGFVLMVLCTALLTHRAPIHVDRGGRWADGLVGLGGGLLGGVAGLSGPLPTLWASLRGWGRDERRAVFQGFNLCVLTLALVSQGLAGYLTSTLWSLVLQALPGTVAGAWLGRRLYGRLNVDLFQRVVLVVLSLAGFAMIASSI